MDEELDEGFHPLVVWAAALILFAAPPALKGAGVVSWSWGAACAPAVIFLGSCVALGAFGGWLARTGR